MSLYMENAGFEIPPEIMPYLLHQKIDNSSLEPAIFKVNVVFIPIIIFFTSLRFAVRFRMLRSAGLDDILMVVALLSALLLSTSCLIGISFGLGKHIWNLNPVLADLAYDVGRVTKALYGCYLAYATAITFTKLSIMATYIRIFPNGLLRYTIYGIGVIVIVFWITSIFSIIFTCIPVEAAWDYSIRDAKCIHILTYFYTSTGVNIATDLLLCFLPLPTIWSLQMAKAQRVVVCFIFGLGFFACIASVLRLIQLKHLTGIDVPYQTVSSLNWSVIEVGTAIVCSSLSSLRPLATRYLPGAFSHFTAHTSDLPSLRLDTLSSLTTKASKASPHSQTRSMVDSRIYVQKSFDMTEFEVSQKDDVQENTHEIIRTVSVMSMRKPSEVYTEASRGSSQENLVRETERMETEK